MKYIMGFRKEKFTQCLEIKTRSLCKCPEKLNAELKYFKKFLSNDDDPSFFQNIYEIGNNINFL